MEADATEQSRRRLLFDVVVQNLKGTGASPLDEFLDASCQSEPPLSPGGVSKSQNTKESAEEGSGDDVVASSAQSLVLDVHATQQHTPEHQTSMAARSNGPASANHADAGMDNDKPVVTSPPIHPLPSKPASGPVQLAADMDEFTRQIEECCMEWRAGRIKPYWLVINEPRFGRTQGCVLRIQLSLSVAKVYSVNTGFPTFELAKKECAKAAIEQGVLDFIRYGDGQTQPAVKLGLEDGECFTGEPIPRGLEDLRPWPLQVFYEALPRPFPEEVGDKSATEINAPAWLNTMIQSARGSRLALNLTWTSESLLHGAVLRLERPGEAKSWMVAARFQKRNEAKNAVCLLAMSEGVGAWIRGIITEVEQRFTFAMRKTVNDVLWPTLLMEYGKAKPHAEPAFTYEHVVDACGCTMTIEPVPGLSRSYVAPPDYRNRSDARDSAIVRAFREGVVEFIRFEGQPPPPNHIPLDVDRLAGFGGSKAQSHKPSQPQGQKRKNTADQSQDGGGHQGAPAPRKKFKQNGRFQGRPGQNRPYVPYGAAPYAPPTPNGMWGSPAAPAGAPGYHPPTYPTQNAAYTQAYSPQPPSNNAYQPANSAALPPYGYGTPAPAPAPAYGAYPGVQAPPPPPYNMYGGAGYAPLQSPYTAAPPPPAPQPAPPPQAQQYSPHTTGAPIMYGMPQPYSPAPAVAPTPPYPIPIPQAAFYPPSPMGAMPYGSPAPNLPPYGYPANNSANGLAGQKRGRGAPSGPFGGKKTFAIQSAPKSSVTELYDHCAKSNLPPPEFCHEIAQGNGNSMHKVWIIIGKQKYELPTQYASLSQGQERVAKRVLEQLHS